MFKQNEDITIALQDAINGATKVKGSVIVPAGKYYATTINLKSNVELVLEKGCEIHFSSDINDYKLIGFVHNELGDAYSYLYAINEENIKITGLGKFVLNGSDFFLMDSPNVPDNGEFNEEQKKECTRNFKVMNQRVNVPIFFHECKNVELRGIEVHDAPCWTITMSDSMDITVENVKIRNGILIPNSDGIHFCGCKNIIVRNCDIYAGDDCLAFTSITDWNAKSENILVENCTLETASKAISLGYIHSQLENVIIRNVNIKRSNRGIVVMCDPKSSCVKNVLIENCTIEGRIYPGNWWGNGEPILIMAVPHNYLGEELERKIHYNVDNFVIRNVNMKGEMPFGIIGTDNNIRNIILENINIERKETENIHLKGRCFDVAPAPANIEFDDVETTLFVQNVENLKYENITTSGKITIK